MTNDIDALRQKLFCGAFHGFQEKKVDACTDIGAEVTVTLTREECRTLWRILTGRRKISLPRGRKHDPNTDDRDKAAAWLVAFYEASGSKVPKNVVPDVMKIYGMTRTQVYEAKKKYPYDATGLNPVRLQTYITIYELKKFPSNNWTKIP